MKKQGLFLVLVALAFVIGMKISKGKVEPVLMTAQASEFKNEIEKDGAVIVDIRTPEEYESGRIAGAINIDYYDTGFRQKIKKLGRNKPYKIYCNSGNRSSKAMAIMEDLGFSDVVELGGGIQSWMAFDLPTCTDC